MGPAHHDDDPITHRRSRTAVFRPRGEQFGLGDPFPGLLNPQRYSFVPGRSGFGGCRSRRGDLGTHRRSGNRLPSPGFSHQGLDQLILAHRVPTGHTMLLGQAGQITNRLLLQTRGCHG